MHMKQLSHLYFLPTETASVVAAAMVATEPMVAAGTVAEGTAVERLAAMEVMLAAAELDSTTAVLRAGML